MKGPNGRQIAVSAEARGTVILYQKVPATYIYIYYIYIIPTLWRLPLQFHPLPLPQLHRCFPTCDGQLQLGRVVRRRRHDVPHRLQGDDAVVALRTAWTGTTMEIQMGIYKFIAYGFIYIWIYMDLDCLVWIANQDLVFVSFSCYQKP